ncbi:MAG: hypothetical protein AAFQ71_05545 [Planctomycetota bacterium]
MRRPLIARIARRLPHPRRLAVPAAFSLAVHLALLAAVLAASVVVTQPAPPTENTVATINLDLDPAATAPAAPAPSDRPDPAPGRSSAGVPSLPAPTPAPERIASNSTALRASESLTRALSEPPPAPRVKTISPAALAVPPADAARFAGLRARRASRIVFAVDASGAMVTGLPFVLRELERSIATLRPTQSFNVILFGADPTNPGTPRLASPPLETGRDALARATTANRQRAIAWLAGRTPVGGRSDPVLGLRAALALEPDAVFLLSVPVRRSADTASSEERAAQALDELRQLNPLDPRDGRRPASIQTIQFIERDDARFLERVALEHGGGPAGFRFLSIEELAGPGPGLAPAPAQGAEPNAADGPTSAELAAAREAAEALAEAQAEIDTLLLTIPTPEQRAGAEAAAARALALLEPLPPPTSDKLAPGAAVLRARAALTLSIEQRFKKQRPRLAQDLARRAVENTASVRPIDPAAEVERAITLALAFAELERSEDARDALLDLIENATVLELDPAGRTRIALAAHRLGLGPDAQATLPEATRSLDQLARAAAETRRALDQQRPIAEALAPLLGSPAPSALPIAARALLLFDRAAELEQLDAPRRAPLERALAAEIARAPARLAEAAERLAALATPGDVRDAASLYRRAGRPDRADELLWRLATDHRNHPAAPDAAAIGVEFALASDAFDEIARTRRLATALRWFPDHPEADLWRLRLAERTDPAQRFSLLDRIDPTSPLGQNAAALELRTARDLLDANPPEPAPLLERAARAAARLGLESPVAQRLALARSVEESDPRRAEALYEELQAAEPIRSALGLMRTRLALERPSAALRSAESLAAVRADPSHPSYWEANTLRLEAAAAIDDPALSAHVIALRARHPDLGGEPWRSRLEALLTPNAEPDPDPAP